MYMHVAFHYAPSSMDYDIGNMEQLFEVHAEMCNVIFRLDEHCHRAVLLHCCPDSTGCNRCGHISLHAPDVPGAGSAAFGRWTVLGSREGYPPRSG